MEVRFTGASGAVYSFLVFGIDDDFEDYDALYIYAQEEGNYFIPKYIGMSTELGTRLTCHNSDGVRECAEDNGADCLLIMPYQHPTGLYGLALSPENALRGMEKDLLSNYNTPCNIQHNY